ncbi:MAG: PIG-L family deacetylase, partial [Ilumatobacteraceae bacterium]
TRHSELAAAAGELGISAVHQFDHPDGQLDTVGIGELVAEIQPLVRDVDLLLVFDEAGITGHPDHIHATAAAVAVAERHDLTVVAWTIDLHVAATLNAEFGAGFVGHNSTDIDLRLPVDRRRQRAAMQHHDSQFTGNPVPGRRIELTGDTEPLRYLRHASTPAQKGAA